MARASALAGQLEIAAGVCAGLAAIFLPLWLSARGTDPHGGFMIGLGALLLAVAAVGLWLFARALGARALRDGRDNLEED